MPSPPRFLYDFYHYFYMLTNALFYVSSTINPILYNLISKKYRAAAWKLLLARRSRERGFCRSREAEGNPAGNRAGCTENSANMQKSATSTGALSHGSAT